MKHAAASIWFEILGSWIRVKKSNFPGNFQRNFDFSWQISEIFWFFQAISQTTFDYRFKN